MTQDEMRALNVGDLIRHKGDSSQTLVVTGNYGSRVTAVRVADVTNPIEWTLVAKAGHKVQ